MCLFVNFNRSAPPLHRSFICGGVFFLRHYRIGRDIFGNSATDPTRCFNEEIEKDLWDGIEAKSAKAFINAYRRFGHLQAELDPLKFSPEIRVPELDPEVYGFEAEDMQLPVREGSQATLAQLIDNLRKIYCGNIAVEFMHLRNAEERYFFAKAFEQSIAERLPTQTDRIDALKIMLKMKAWENFVATKFPTLKRYSGEGAESIAAFYQKLLEDCPKHEITEFIFDGAHRGRLALQTVLFNFPPGQIFRKIRGKTEIPDNVRGMGDVLTHQHSHFDFETTSGGIVHLSTLPNPSHLEVSLPVAVGKARARAQTLRVGDYGDGIVGDQILSVHHHGDGAFSGQGVVWETLAMSQIPHFRVGGSIHLVVNNQIAFTAEKSIGRSSLHCTDAAKAIDSPVIHINAEEIEKLLFAAEIAAEYRQKFRKDIFVNLICWRRYGHNELDDPTFTQPLLYRAVNAKHCLVSAYADKLAEEGVFSRGDAESVTAAHTEHLRKELELVNSGQTQPIFDHLGGYWKGYQQAPSVVTTWDTGLDTDLLKFIGAASVAVPETFNIHPHLKKMHIDGRRKRIASGEIDWSTAEALAIGSLLLQGIDVRLSGQDVGRATFSHRHAMFVDQKTDSVYIPLNHLLKEQNCFLEIANSPLTEAAIVGFEYGFAIENPARLVIWEAQFGDFYNGAQVQIDTLIANGESKWLLQNGLCLLLPHGIDGAGPDHSSAHIERFLQLSDSRETQSPPDGDDVNIQVANPTTSAQYYHLLRRQIVTPFRKPLVIIAPKLLLRHSSTICPISEFAGGTSFKPILLDQKRMEAEKVKKIIFCSGKHAVTLTEERNRRQRTTEADDGIAIIRIERLCPFPLDELSALLATYRNANNWVWSQEEPRNAGCWTFIEARFRNAFGISLKYVGRPELAWFATSIGDFHRKEIEEVIEKTFTC